MFSLQQIKQLPCFAVVGGKPCVLFFGNQPGYLQYWQEIGTLNAFENSPDAFENSP